MIFEALGRHKYRGKPFWMHNVVANAKYFVTDYYKQNPVSAYGTIEAPWSLNDVVPGTEGLRRIDIVSDGPEAMW